MEQVVKSHVSRTAGVVCLVAGLLGAASGIWLSLVDAEVGDDRYSYPLAAGAFITVQIWFAVQHLGLLAGQWALRASGVAGPGRAAGWGHIVGLAGMALLTVTEVLAAGAADDPYPSSFTQVLDGLYGISCTAIGVGLTIVGLAVRQTRAWTGWHAWVPLAIGVWVFIPMMPAIMVGYLPARLSITAWMLLYAALGWALVVTSRRTTRELVVAGQLRS